MALQNWQVDLREKGYAVIPDVLTPDECLSLENGFWNFWRRLSGGLLTKKHPQTWKIIFDFFPRHGMLLQHFSIGHLQEIWNVRSHEKLRVYSLQFGVPKIWWYHSMVHLQALHLK
mmetsp:Transcript_13442/g.32411  ORF Transcript_13442/g.32411 Transcript_13442/m.32411 type:complete len:116 (+) Transcript_13442:142-489(+)